MSEKRFTFEVLNSNLVEIKDNEEPMNIGEVVELLNELSTSCRQLQGKVKRLNAFIVSKDLATEYLKWNKECDIDE